MAVVSRIGRLLDGVGLAAFLVGGGVYARAWFGFREVEASAPASVDPQSSAIELADRFWFMERIGGGLMLLGIAVFVGAWWIERQQARDG
jgi:hypothetical protein